MPSNVGDSHGLPQSTLTGQCAVFTLVPLHVACPVFTLCPLATPCQKKIFRAESYIKQKDIYELLWGRFTTFCRPNSIFYMVINSNPEKAFVSWSLFWKSWKLYTLESYISENTFQKNRNIILKADKIRNKIISFPSNNKTIKIH